ncbi:MAG TPA: hypothetical protein VE826_05365 [Dongiaceae bacterium]|nr:hypothetical protein [Dongiaceae bacterium]
MFALDAASRAVLAATAFAAFGAAFVTTPLVARGDAGIAPDAAPSVVPLRPRTALADVSPQRDPFAGGDTTASPSNAASPQAPVVMPAMPPLPQIPAALRALPPNAGAGDAPFPFATGARTSATVPAVITGPHPFALVDESGTTRILTVGDRIDGDAIVAIDAAGIRLSNGLMLAVERATDSSAPPPSPARAILPAPMLAPAPPLPPLARPNSGGR